MMETQLQAPEETAVLCLMRAAADRFTASLRAEPGGAELRSPPQPTHGSDLRWRNTLFIAPTFRRAHVELLEIENHFAVVHVVILPQLASAAPIFGFDMIAGQTQATGIFLDFSPVTSAPPAPRLGDVLAPAERARFTCARKRPEWGTIFSADFFAIRPVSLDEIRAALALAERACAFHLRHLGASVAVPGQASPAVIQGHAAYATAQRANPHTRRMLTRFIGASAANAFIEEILFPMPA